MEMAPPPPCDPPLEEDGAAVIVVLVLAELFPVMGSVAVVVTVAVDVAVPAVAAVLCWVAGWVRRANVRVSITESPERSNAGMDHRHGNVVWLVGGAGHGWEGRRLMRPQVPPGTKFHGGGDTGTSLSSRPRKTPQLNWLVFQSAVALP
jgi:hypothetical protein